jgi:NitT/TauT family transport system ATP-binding protein
MLKPDSGTVTFSGSAEKKNAKIGFVFQDYRSTLFPWRRNIDNVAFPLEIAGWSAKRRNEHVKAFLSELSIDLPLQGFPYELSGGYQQMVAILIGLSQETICILAYPAMSASGRRVLMKSSPLLQGRLQAKRSPVWPRAALE